MTRVYLSAGSNIEREHNVRSGLDALCARFGALIVSAIYESKAFGFSGDNFYNLVVGFDTDEGVEAVVRALQEIEERHGRDRSGPRFSSRTLDLDLLTYGDLVMRSPDLTLPRPEILKRTFVLAPLAEVAPHDRHPVTGQTYAELWQAMDKTGQELWPVNSSTVEELKAGERYQCRSTHF